MFFKMLPKLTKLGDVTLSKFDCNPLEDQLETISNQETSIYHKYRYSRI